MIRSFADEDTERLFNKVSVRRFQAFERTAYRKLVWLDEAESLSELRGPGHQLEKLTGNRAGQLSIRINDQWRICFIWKGGEAFDVAIVDYH